MLILTRKVGEEVIMNKGTIKMTVLDYDHYRDCITIGFNAPSDIDIDRKEIYIKKCQQRQEF